MELAHPPPSDGQLVAAVRSGSSAAWAEIEARHASAVFAVAKAQRTRHSRRAAQAALERVLTSIVDDAPVTDDVAAVRALRPLMIAELTGGFYGPGGDGVLEDDDRALAEGFARLPQSWQTVLWHGVVERRTAAEMTPLLARGVNEVDALLRTASSGLHESYLRVIVEHHRSAPECAAIVPLLGAAARGTLAAPDQRVVDAHLTTGGDGSPCRDCRARLDVVETLDDRLPAAIVPGIARLGVDRYRAVVVGRGLAFGSAALLASRSERVRRFAVVSAVVAIALALVGAALLIRRPFEGSTSVTTVEAPASTAPPVTTAAPAEPEEPAPSTSAEPPAPTTTELQLRPPPSGPRNTVELVFVPPTPALGVVAPDIDLTVALSAPAPVFAGGTGTIDVEISNEAVDAADIAFEVRESRGLLLDRLVDGDAECVDRAEGAPLCTLSLGAGETKTLALRFLLESSAVGRLVVESELVAEPLEVAIDATERLLHSSVARGELVMIGNTVLSCADLADGCADARAGRGDVVNRWDLPLEFVGAGTSVSNSSAATLELPAASTVEVAYLLWSGDLRQSGEEIPDDGRHERVSLLAPGGGAPIPVEADRTTLGDFDATQYMGFADVTDVVAAAGAGDYVVRDLQTVEVTGSYGGWSLVVVTADDSEPRRSFVVTVPFSWFAPDDDYVAAIPVPAEGATDGSLDLLAFEGEPGFRPESLVVGGTEVGGDNEFDSSIVGPRDPSFVNSFGTDVEAYALTIDEPDGSLTLRATSRKDGVRLAVIGLAVDLDS